RRVLFRSLLAGVRVVSADAAAHRVLAAGESDDDLAVVVERCCRDAVAVLGIRREHVPDHVAGALVERDEPPVESADEDLAVAHADAAAQAAAADEDRKSTRL